MIKFLLKGILRDKSKSLIPICVISLGVFITVFMSGFVEGVLSEMISSNANLDTGHLKIMTKPYKENKDQLPNDLALLEIDLLIDSVILFFWLNSGRKSSAKIRRSNKTNIDLIKPKKTPPNLSALLRIGLFSWVLEILTKIINIEKNVKDKTKVTTYETSIARGQFPKKKSSKNGILKINGKIIGPNCIEEKKDKIHAKIV